MSALDLAIKYNQSEVRKLLEEKGAKKSNEIREDTTTTDYVLTDSTFSEAFARAYYYLTKELTFESRNTILVVATLIVSATYQSVLQPREDSLRPQTTHKPPREA